MSQLRFQLYDCFQTVEMFFLFYKQGDSGTPLSCYASASDPDNAVRYVAGLGSFGQMTGGNCNPVYPSVYVRLSSYLDWIRANTGA